MTAALSRRRLLCAACALPLASLVACSRDENAGIVRGEVGDWTAGGGASRQGVTCRWDGLMWQIERDPVRMTW